MPKVQHVLCAIDFSPTSVAVLQYATLIARADEAAVHAVHVYSLPVLSGVEGAALLPRELEDGARESSSRSLRALIDEHRDPAVPTAAYGVSGTPAEAIVREARRCGCDLIVVGTGGRTGLPRLLLGSVAERVLHKSPIDVLVVPAGVEVSPAKRIGSILCAVDFSAPAEAALLAACDLAAKHGARLHVVHAWEPPAHLAEGAELALTTREQELARDLEALVHRHPVPRVSVTRHLRRGLPSAEIVALAAELDVDLVVMGTTGRTGVERFLLGSVAERVVRSSAAPVLTVRPPTGA